MVKHDIEKLIKDAIDLIEDAIKEEPEYVDYYIGIKHTLEEAYMDIGFPLND